MTLKEAGSVGKALARSLLVGLTLVWLTGVVGSAFVLKRLIDEKSDDELSESAAILMSVVNYQDDLLIAAAVLGETGPPSGTRETRHRYAYEVRDASGRVLLRSANATAVLDEVPLREGIGNAGPWRVVTMANPVSGRFLQLADPLAERHEALLTAVAWLTVPLAALLAFAAYVVFRTTRSLAQQVQRTANAVSRQDPQALGLLPLDDVVTEMKPAVEATNRLLARLGAALEAERSFTYNSAHELRTPIAAALAQAQLLASQTAGTDLNGRTNALVGALSRLAKLAERLLALARAEGAQPLAEDWVDLPRVVALVIGEFEHDARLSGRRVVAKASPARVRGDLDAVGLALRNLFENAIVHGAGGSTIRVECGETPAGTVLAVIDDGHGVNQADIESLVKRFARGKRAQGSGAGLGLSIVDTLARRMGATLRLNSPPDGAERGFEARLTWQPAPQTKRRPSAS